MTQYERIDPSKGIDLNKQADQISVKSVITTISTMVLNFIQKFVMIVVV